MTLFEYLRPSRTRLSLKPEEKPELFRLKVDNGFVSDGEGVHNAVLAIEPGDNFTIVSNERGFKMPSTGAFFLRQESMVKLKSGFETTLYDVDHCMHPSIGDTIMPIPDDLAGKWIPEVEASDGLDTYESIERLPTTWQRLGRVSKRILPV